VRDKKGLKMSKTLGNSPDPLDLIARFGADALRFGIMRSAPLGQDVLYDEQHVELGRNFCNKLWNACRFRQMQGGEVQGEINSVYLNTDDKWILLKLGDAIRELTDALTEYRFNEATTVLYRFFWSEFCDWYLETCKAVLQGSDDARKANTLAVLDFVLSHALRLFHPFLPFITEELWQGLGYNEDMPAEQGRRTIMNAPWPKQFDRDFRDFYGLDDCYLDFANAKYDLITKGRNLRRVYNIPANQKVQFVLKTQEEPPPTDLAVIKLLLNADGVEVRSEYTPPRGTPAVHSSWGELFLPVDGLIDVQAELAKFRKEAEKYEAEIAKVQQKLSNPNFVQKVPPEVLAEHQQRLADWQVKLATVRKAIEDLS
jgi:valyl-tRNA synthetase